MTSIAMDPRIRARRAEVLKLRGRRRLRVLLVFLGATAVAVGGWWLVVKSPLLDVDNVTVSGAEHTDPDLVVDVSGVDKGQSLVEVDTNAARSAIAGLPWVESVTSHRGFGGEVRFDINERTAAAVVATDGGWVLVDGVGKVLEAVEAVPADVVVVDGDLGALTPGDWVPDSRLGALEVAAQLPSGLKSKVSTVAGSGSDLNLVLFGGGTVNIGDARELEAKFLSAMTLLVRLDIACLDRIDVRAPAVPVLTRIAGCS